MNRTMRNLRLIGLAAAAFLLVGAGKPAPAARVNWNTAIAVTPDGSHVLGNPAAQLKLTEYVSYTCPHCAHFVEESDAQLRLGYVAPGKLSIEVRHLVRDPVDLTVAMLTNCGVPAKFYLNHNAFMLRQSIWIEKLSNSTPAQRQRWSSGDGAARRKAIASDFGFYPIMESRGYSRVIAERCLGDEAMAQRLARQTQAALGAGVQATPSFAINGLLLIGTSDWHMLEPQLRARL